ncbi:hypothetical protein [Streptomyces hydrogenans]|uniref:hypothetical protein n=1 Tax=Streptomyces hydrogenans TaxID=1873719 RepID=UPI0033AA8CFB
MSQRRSRSRAQRTLTRRRSRARTAWTCRWGALQPDRLAERHIGRILDTDPAIAEHLINGADDAQTAQLLTGYSRAAAHLPSTAASTPTSPA